MALKITHNIILDMQRPRLEVVHVMQEDSKSRWIHADLFNGDGTPWTPPIPNGTNPKIVLRCKKTNGTYCSYSSETDPTLFNIPTTTDTPSQALPSVEVCLAEQVTASAGKFPVDIIFFEDDKRLSTFSFMLDVVKAAATEGEMASIDYIRDRLVNVSADAEDVSHSAGADVDVEFSETGNSFHFMFKIPAGLTKASTSQTYKFAQSTYYDINHIPTTWYDTPPEPHASSLSEGWYMWTKVILTYPDEDPVSFYSVTKNGINGSGVPSNDIPNTDGANNGAGASGSSGDVSRKDHSHPINVTTTGTPAMSAATGSHGNSSTTTYARSDHVHPVAVQTKTKTLTTTWTNNAQTLTDNDFFISDGYSYVVSPAPGSFENYTKAQVYASAVGTGTMTFACKKAPSEALTVEIVRMVTS